MVVSRISDVFMGLGIAPRALLNRFLILSILFLFTLSEPGIVTKILLDFIGV